MLVAEAERKLGVVEHLASVVEDSRNLRKVRHGTEEMLAQRVFGIAARAANQATSPFPQHLEHTVMDFINGQNQHYACS